jgi:hypothetical protein
MVAGRSVALVLALAFASTACSEAAPSIILDIRSPLAIPTEANGLGVRLLDDRTVLREESYSLGSAPRDRWPQSLPIVPGPSSPKALSIVLELRLTTGAAPSEIVGFAVASATFPATGVTRIDVEIGRACSDVDGDGFGAGAGCRGSDCDETRREAPDPEGCEVPDGGTPDSGPCGGRCGASESCCREQCVPACDNFACGEDRLCRFDCDGCECIYPCAGQPGRCGLNFPCVNGCCQLR